MNDQNDKINNQELNKSVQNVHSFGVQNDDLQAKEEIGNRINESKKKNLDNNTKRTSKDDTTGADSSANGKTLPKKDGLDDGNSTSLKDKFNPKNILQGAGRSALRKKSEDDTLAGNAAKVANKALDAKAKIDSVKALITFLMTPVGKIVALIFAGILGLILMAGLAAMLANPFQLVISSISMKFGLSGKYSYDASTRDNEEYEYMYEGADREYEEGDSRKEIEEMVDSAVDEEGNKLECKLTIWEGVKLFLNISDMSDPCEFTQYLKKQLERAESKTGIANIAPGYIMTTFYYAFETQNYNEDGKPFITQYIDNTAETEEDDEDYIEITSDLDAINLLFGHKKANGQTIFDRADITLLIYQYVYQEHYNYYVYEKDPETDIYSCRLHTSTPTYKIDVDKYKLFLRYGYFVSVGTNIYNPYITYPFGLLGIKTLAVYDILNELPNMKKYGNRGYEADKNIIAAYDATSAKCYEQLKDMYGTKPEDMSVYQIKAFPDKTGDDGAVINLSSGSYDYSDGFIFTRYPRYMEEFTISGTVTFDYFVAKEIEKFIEHISDRQDYGNYLLGYESDVGKLYGNQGNGSTGKYKIICDYSELENGNVSTVDGNIKVEWMYPDKLKFDAFDYEPNTSMGKTVDLETYVLGSLMLEAGGSLAWIENYYATNAEETVKARAIMIRSFLLANANISSSGTIQIANSTTRQLTCDPDEGCYRCADSNATGDNGNGNYIAVPIDSEFAQNNSQCKKIDPLPADSELRNLAKEVAGQVMVDSNGNVASTNYNDTSLAEWYKDSNTDTSISDLDYAELLYYQYGEDGFTLEGVECHIEYEGGNGWDGINFVSNAGPWDEWKQDDPRWADDPLGYSGATIGGMGCNLVAFAKGLADKAADKITLDNFNPQTFAAVAYDNQCFCEYVNRECVPGIGTNTIYACAASAVGVSISGLSVELTGSYQDKVNTVASYNDDNTIVLLQVKGKSGTHWVYVKGTTSNDIIMSDPSSMHNDTDSVKEAYVDGTPYPDGGEITDLWYFKV